MPENSALWAIHWTSSVERTPLLAAESPSGLALAPTNRTGEQQIETKSDSSSVHRWQPERFQRGGLYEPLFQGGWGVFQTLPVGKVCTSESLLCFPVRANLPSFLGWSASFANLLKACVKF
eukprot:scaffold840_cov344-Pavlova_lutheri.AAC.79